MPTGTGRIDKQAVVGNGRTEREYTYLFKTVDSTTKGGNEQHEDLITDLQTTHCRRATAHGEG